MGSFPLCAILHQQAVAHVNLSCNICKASAADVGAGSLHNMLLKAMRRRCRCCCCYFEFAGERVDLGTPRALRSPEVTSVAHQLQLLLFKIVAHPLQLLLCTMMLRSIAAETLLRAATCTNPSCSHLYQSVLACHTLHNPSRPSDAWTLQ